MSDSFLQFMITYILVRYNHVIVIFLLFLFIYFFFFTSFSGHKPAQTEWARTGLIGPLRDAISTQSLKPVKVGHTTGAYVPLSFRKVVWVLLRPTKTR